MASEQIAVRLSTELLDDLDDVVRAGVYESRAAAARAGIEVIVERERQHRIDRSIVEGYTRIPPTVQEQNWAAASIRDAIAAEPW